MNPQKIAREQSASGTPASAYTLPMRFHDLFLPSKSTISIHPEKRKSMYLWTTGTLSITCFALLNIFDKFSFECWKSIISLLGAFVFLGMWAMDKWKSDRHKNRMRNLEYEERQYRFNQLKNLNADPEKEVGI